MAASYPEVGEEADDTLPQLTDGEAATLRDPRVGASAQCRRRVTMKAR